MNQDMINKINRIPIFDIMNVKGYCVYIEGVIRTFVYAADIAREAGMTRSTKGRYFYEAGYPTSGITDYEVIRWDRFNNYVNMSLPAIQQENPSLIQLIQLPIHAYSYIPCELALIVLMHCKSNKALRFQVRLATIIMPKIQQDTIEFYEEQMQKMQDDIEDLQECIDCRNVSRMEELEEDNDKLRYLIRQYEPMLGSVIYQYQEYRGVLNK